MLCLLCLSVYRFLLLIDLMTGINTSTPDMAIITMSGPSIFGADVMTRKQSAAHRRVSTTHWALLSGFRIGGMEYGYVFFEIRAFIRANPGVRPVEVRRISFFFWRRKGPKARSFFSGRSARLRALPQLFVLRLIAFPEVSWPRWRRCRQWP